MKYLLDTHTFLWAATNSSRLSSTASDVIENTDNTPLVSMACLWEIAIKLSTGKLRIDVPFTHFAIHAPLAHGIERLPITLDHLAVVTRLPFHHRDAFDRLLVAQALVEDLPIVSIDTVLDDSGVERLW